MVSKNCTGATAESPYSSNASAHASRSSCARDSSKEGVRPAADRGMSATAVASVGFHARRVRPGPLQGGHDFAARLRVAQQGQQELLDADAGAALARRLLRRFVKRPPGVRVQVFVESSQVH